MVKLPKLSIYSAQTVAAGLSRAKHMNVQINRRFRRLFENSSQTCLSRYFSSKICCCVATLRILITADNSATPPQAVRVPYAQKKDDFFKSSCGA